MFKLLNFFFFFQNLEIWRQQETGIIHNKLGSLELYGKCGSVGDIRILVGQSFVGSLGWNFFNRNSFANSALPIRDRTYASVYYVNTSEDLFRLIV